jgi:hypothetical protein
MRRAVLLVAILVAGCAVNMGGGSAGVSVDREIQGTFGGGGVSVPSRPPAASAVKR